MEKEIKFRAWDESIKMFHKWNKDFNYFNGSFWKIVKDENLPVSQYIGKKDSKGNEVYSGDILQYYFMDSGKKSTELYVVKWDSDRLCFIGINSKPIYRFEIIGNIYENDNLLRP